MSKPILLGSILLAILALGVGFAGGRATAPAASRADGADPEPVVARLERENAALREEVEALRARTVPRLEGASQGGGGEARASTTPAAEPATSEVAGAAAEGVSWARLETVLGETMNLLLALKDRDPEDMTPEEQQRVFAVLAELTRVTTEAKALSAHPFFDDRVLPGLVRAVFGGGLDLPVPAREALARATRDVLARQAAGFDPTAALPLERYRKRREIEQALANAVRDVFPPEQRQRYEAMREIQSELFGGSRKVVTYGLEDPSDRDRIGREIVAGWAGTYGLTETQQADALDAASGLLRTAQDLLAQHGIGAGASWEVADEPALAEALLDAQIEAEASFLRRMPVDQRERANAAMPTVLLFDRTTDTTTQITTGPGI